MIVFLSCFEIAYKCSYFQKNDVATDSDKLVISISNSATESKCSVLLKNDTSVSATLGIKFINFFQQLLLLLLLFYRTNYFCVVFLSKI